MTYHVRLKKKVAHALLKLPKDVQQLFYLLAADLKEEGPIQREWRNFSSLGGNRYRCHLNYRYVACWTCEKQEIVIEVYYVGFREKAPY